MISTLPPELLARIIEQLLESCTGPRTRRWNLQSVQLVSRAWHEEATWLGEVIVTSRGQLYRLAASLRASAGRDSDSTTSSPLPHFASRARKLLVSSQLYDQELEGAENVLDELGPEDPEPPAETHEEYTLRKAKEWHDLRTTASEVMNRLCRVRELELEGDYQYKPLWAVWPLSQCEMVRGVFPSTLRRLSVYSRTSGDANLSLLLDRCPSLTAVESRGTVTVIFDSDVDTGRRLPGVFDHSLVDLHISAGDAKMIRLASILPQSHATLQSLHLSFESHIRDAVLTILTPFVALRYLHYTTPQETPLQPAVVSDLWLHLSRLRHLETLSLELDLDFSPELALEPFDLFAPLLPQNRIAPPPPSSSTAFPRLSLFRLVSPGWSDSDLLTGLLEGIDRRLKSGQYATIRPAFEIFGHVQRGFEKYIATKTRVWARDYEVRLRHRLESQREE